MYARPIQNLIRAFSRLPSVGQRTAERFVFYLLKSGKKDVAELTLAMKQLIESVKSCEVCWDFSDQSPCHICSNPKRDQSMICMVKEPQDVQAIERTNTYHGVYHVLRGVVKTEHESDLQDIKIREFLERAKKEEVKEIILALNPDLPGETTMMYLEHKLKELYPDLKVTRLARGLPMGSDLQYADEITLGSALKNRLST